VSASQVCGLIALLTGTEYVNSDQWMVKAVARPEPRIPRGYFGLILF
jgi:hypothetical protein